MYCCMATGFIGQTYCVHVFLVSNADYPYVFPHIILIFLMWLPSRSSWCSINGNIALIQPVSFWEPLRVHPRLHAFSDILNAGLYITIIVIYRQRYYIEIRQRNGRGGCSLLYSYITSQGLVR